MKKYFSLGLLCLYTTTLVAQNPSDAARYFDPIPAASGANFNTSGGFGVLATDFSSISFNPAMSALFGKSYIDLNLNGLLNRSKANYINNDVNSSESYFSISSFSGVFKFPTKQGSLAFSLGYVQKGDYSNSFTANGFNTTNSISDYLAQASSSDIRLIGYNGYATDSIGTELQSVLRFSNFSGIDQYVQENESGQQGDFLINMATEFQKDIFVGLTIGIPLATYHYERVYLEDDLQNQYSTTPFDVSSIFATEKVNATAAGIYAKLGLVIKPAEQITLGLSYQTPYSLELNESYLYSVNTLYDDGFGPSNDFPYRLEGDFSYKIQNPGIINIGLGIKNLSNFSLGLSAEYKNFNGLEFNTDSEFKRFEIEQNKLIKNDFVDVINVTAGLGYDFGKFSYQLGMAYMPSYLKFGGNDRYIYSTGIESRVSDQMKLFAGFRYQKIESEKSLYQTSDFGSSPLVKTTLTNITTQIGVTINF